MIMPLAYSVHDSIWNLLTGKGTTCCATGKVELSDIFLLRLPAKCVNSQKIEEAKVYSVMRGKDQSRVYDGVCVIGECTANFPAPL